MRRALRWAFAALILLVAAGGLALRTDRGLGLVQAWAMPAPEADVPTLSPIEPGATPLVLVPLVTGIPQPTDLAPVPGHPDRLVVLSKTGTAWLVTPGQAPTPWFTVEVRTASELGLLGLAFAPDFAASGDFVVHYNPADGERRTVLRRGHVDPKTLAAPTLGDTLYTVAQPYNNHDGGQVAWRPDGVYLALGDGGSANDPEGRGQDLSEPLGSILRLDPSLPAPHVPPDNPFVGRPGARPEVWAYGLRNPWRFTFAPDGRMVVADVGQGAVEEVDLVGAGDNLGWRIREGERCFQADTCASAGLVDPIWSYTHDQGSSITGGVVATAGPLAGRYVVADFGSGRFWAIDLPDRPRRVEASPLGRFACNPVAFARAPDGGVWVADFMRGAIFSLRAP